ncbi:unnamed protein product, partial [Brassica oleracea var. botrytis]
IYDYYISRIGCGFSSLADYQVLWNLELIVGVPKVEIKCGPIELHYFSNGLGKELKLFLTKAVYLSIVFLSQVKLGFYAISLQAHIRTLCVVLCSIFQLNRRLS